MREGANGQLHRAGLWPGGPRPFETGQGTEQPPPLGWSLLCASLGLCMAREVRTLISTFRYGARDSQGLSGSPKVIGILQSHIALATEAHRNPPQFTGTAIYMS